MALQNLWGKISPRVKSVLIKSDKSLTVRVENIELFPSYYPRISLSFGESFLAHVLCMVLGFIRTRSDKHAVCFDPVPHVPRLPVPLVTSAPRVSLLLSDTHAQLYVAT